MTRRTHKFFDPELERLAAIAAEIEAEMLYASTTAENAVLTTLTGSAYAAFLGINTASPGTTGANEETAGGTVAVTDASTTYSAGIATFTTGTAHGLSVGNSVSFLGLTGTGWSALNTVAGGQGAYVVTSVPTTTSFTVAVAVTTYATNPTGSGTVQIGYSRVGIAWGSPSGGSVANTNTLVVNIPASTIGYFSTWAQITGTGGNGYIFGGTLSSITFPSPGTVTIATGGLSESAS